MISDLDIYRSARVLVQAHDRDAAIEAAMRADDMLEKGDLRGFAVWRGIVKAVEELQRMEPAAGRSAQAGSTHTPAPAQRGRG